MNKSICNFNKSICNSISPYVLLIPLFTLHLLLAYQCYSFHCYRFSSDGTVLETWQETSYTPVVSQILSLPPYMRQTYNGHLLLGVMPPKVGMRTGPVGLLRSKNKQTSNIRHAPKWQVKDYNCLYGAIFEHIRASGRPLTEAKIDTAQHAQRSFPLVCFPIIDYSPTCEGEEPVSRDVFCEFNHIVEDTRGMPNPTCGKQAPSVVGTDPTCNQKGVTNKACKTTVYPGAVRLLGRRYLAMCRCAWLYVHICAYVDNVIFICM